MTKKRILTGLIVVGFTATVLAFATGDGALAQDAPIYKNLKILPKNIDKKTLKRTMKTMAKAVGRTCDGCHDTDAFDKDTDLKKAARGMMRLTNAANARLKKDGFEATINCRTCHAGKEKPE